MNTKTRLTVRRISPQTAFRAIASGALFTLAFAAASADQPPATTPATRTAQVSLAGLDVSTPEGAHAAYERVKITAERLCFQLSDSRKIDNQALYATCVMQTLAATMRRLQAPIVAAREK